MSETIDVQKDGHVPIYTGCFIVVPVIDRDRNEAIFAISPFHVTYHYNPGDPIFPEDVKENDWTQIIHAGIYDDGNILASRVHLMRPLISDGNKHERYFSQQPDRLINQGTEEEHYTSGYPLHITWDSGDKPPVYAAEKFQQLLNDKSHKDWKYYTTIQDGKQDLKINESAFKALDLDPDNPEHFDAYSKRITPIFNMLHPMGIWKTFKAEPKEQNLGV